MDALLPVELTMLLAGLGGALVLAFIEPERESVARALMGIVAGTLASFWLTPAICDWRGLNNIHGRHAAAFSLGLVGITFCRLVVSAAKSEQVTRLVKRFFNWPDK